MAENTPMRTSGGGGAGGNNPDNNLSMGNNSGGGGSGGGGGGGGGKKNPLQWISQAVKDELESLNPKIRIKAEQYYLAAVKRQSKPKAHPDMRGAKDRAKERLNDLKKNNIYNASTGIKTKKSGEGGQADVLMREAIVSAQTPKKKKMRGHPGGGRRRRTRRSRRKRRKTKRRRRRRRTKRRRRRRRTKRRS